MIKENNVECLENNRAIFISHSSQDKRFVDKLIDYLTLLGCSDHLFFCSSLPGNDVRQKISTEIKSALTCSKVNIVVLSDAYYKSAYCLNELGIIWFQDKPTIVIALPEINEKNMLGFLNSDYKFRRFNSKEDLLYIHDTICDICNTKSCSTQIVERKSNDTIKDFDKLIKERSSCAESSSFQPDKLTEDEIMLLYFFSKQAKRKYNINEIKLFFITHEMVKVDVDNALDLFSCSGFGNISDEYFEINIHKFRELQKTQIDKSTLEIVKKHFKKRKDIFIKLYKQGKFDETDKLFILYLIETNTEALGAGWKADFQIDDIINWQNTNLLDEIVSKDYGSCLNKFIKYDLCYPSEYTSNGSPREYTLYKSLFDYLDEVDEYILKELLAIKAKMTITLPF